LALNAEQLGSFHENGFLALPAISTPEEIASLRALFDRLMKSRAGFHEGAQFDMLDDNASLGRNSSIQICDPDNYAAQLRHTIFATKALAIAKQLLGPTAQPAFSHAIYKPAHYGGPTPWHQDDAFHADFDYPQISIWMPLQDVTPENGCMHFIRGSHHGKLLAHRPYNDNAGAHALECRGAIDLGNAVACPLPAGGCTIHTGGTLHYAGANNTNRGRWAYILAFYLPPRRRRQQVRTWSDERRTAVMARRKAWLRRGGYFIHWWRNEFINRVRRARGRWL
jgi:ectoine hydroxylase-related dioxygenase (phytanoyl-CoA dioxygenase family)